MRGAWYNLQEARAVLRSAEESASAGRGARGQRVGTNSAPNARERNVVGRQRPTHPLVQNQCPLVHSPRPTHLSSVRVYCSEGGARVGKEVNVH